MSPIDPISFLFWTVITAAIARAGIAKIDVNLRQLAWRIYFAHIGASVALIFVTKYVLGGGDMFAYHAYGGLLVSGVWEDPGRFLPELLKLTLRMESHLPINVHGSKSMSNTGSMFGFAAWLMMITGSSVYGAGALIAGVGFRGKLLLFQIFREKIPVSMHALALLCMTAVPSSLFWTAGLLKEGIAMMTFGPFVYGVHVIAEKRQWGRGSMICLAAGLPIFLVKPYILYPLVVAGVVWIVAASMVKRSPEGRLQVTPAYFVLAAILGVVAVTLLGRATPEYSVENLAQELAQVQRSGLGVSGTSNYTLATEETAQRGLAGQLALAPVALFFALTRPFVFEVKNLQILVNALESTLFTFILLRGLFVRPGIVRASGETLRRPEVLFAVAFVVLFGTAVGLGSTNVGSLSRYRAPMMPFYALVVFVLPKLVEARANGTLNAGVVTPSTSKGKSRVRMARRRRGVPKRVVASPLRQAPNRRPGIRARRRPQRVPIARGRGYSIPRVIPNRRNTPEEGETT